MINRIENEEKQEIDMKSKFENELFTLIDKERILKEKNKLKISIRTTDIEKLKIEKQYNEESILNNKKDL